MKHMKHVKSYAISAVGLLVLFAVFLMFGIPSLPAWGTVKLTDILTIIGGLLFVLPMYIESIKRKDAANARHRWVWYYLPIVGIALVCVGIFIPNSVMFFGLVPFADVLYLIGCLLMLIIYAYPPFDIEHEMLEEAVEDEVEQDMTSGR